MGAFREMEYKLPLEAFQNDASVIIYGTGEVANQYMDQLEERGLDNKVLYFANTYPSEQSTFRGKPVLSLKQLRHHPEKDQWIFVIAAYLSAQSVVDALQDIGIEGRNMVMPIPVQMEDSVVYYPLLRDAVKHIAVYPEANDGVREDLERRFDWYLPNRGDLTLFMTRHALNQQEWQSQLDTCDLILVWDRTRLGDPILQSYKTKTGCVDPEYTVTQEVLIYTRLYYRSLSFNQRKACLDQSILNFERMRNQFRDCKHAYVFGTGPSLERVWDMSLEPASAKIICNSIITKPALINRIDANILVYSDPLWHSHTDFGKEFRAHIVEFLKNKKRFCVVPEMHLPLMVAYFPELKEQMIGLPVTSSIFNIPTAESFSVKETYNVLTRLGFTIAAALAKTVLILGCDGTPISENKGWEHSKSTSDHIIQDDAHAAHAAYIRLDVPNVYYERHYRLMEELFQHGERQGITFRSLAPSYIPALANRQQS